MLFRRHPLKTQNTYRTRVGVYVYRERFTGCVAAIRLTVRGQEYSAGLQGELDCLSKNSLEPATRTREIFLSSKNGSEVVAAYAMNLVIGFVELLSP